MAISQTTKEKIFDLHEKKLTNREIAKKVKVSDVTVGKILKAGRENKTNKITPMNGEQSSKVFQLLENGKTQLQIVIEEKINPQIVLRLHEQYIKLKRPVDPYCDRIYELIDKECSGCGNKYNPFNIAVGYCPHCLLLAFYGIEYELNIIRNLEQCAYEEQAR